jgi:hypothetical protein
VLIGTEGIAEYRVPKERGRVVELRGVRADRHSGAVVWIDGVREEPDATVYSVHFIANIPGEFDLAGLLDRADGQSAHTLPSLYVNAWNVLPEDHDGSLLELARPTDPTLGGYRLAMMIAAVVWTVPLLWILIRRLRKQRPVPLPSLTVPPTLADQLRPLIEAALSGTANRAAQARLEMLLLAFWRDRLRLSGLPHDLAIAELKRHDEAGRLITAVERWLHAPRAVEAAATPAEVASLLTPYRTAAVIEEDFGLMGSAPPSPPSPTTPHREAVA